VDSLFGVQRLKVRQSLVKGKLADEWALVEERDRIGSGQENWLDLVNGNGQWGTKRGTSDLTAESKIYWLWGTE
jgi:hypothetical protein